MKPVRETTVAFERCRRPRCNREAFCRGLCRSDYQTAHQLVTAGATSWEALEKSGRVNEPRRAAKIWFLGGAA